MTTQIATRQRTTRPRKPSVAKSKPKPSTTDARVWLRENGYADVAERIDAVMHGWEAEDKGTRRNWWEALSGGTDGRPYTVEGKEFPVLVAAQRRQGKPVTSNALQRNARETAPSVRKTGRWPTRRKGS
jgi:hypothetical protein